MKVAKGPSPGLGNQNKQAHFIENPFKTMSAMNEWLRSVKLKETHAFPVLQALLEMPLTIVQCRAHSATLGPPEWQHVLVPFP